MSNQYGKTALINAATYRHIEIVKYLIQNGAYKFIKDNVKNNIK
jgi:ankyrin repeat protein